jgi:hypothetical protein
MSARIFTALQAKRKPPIADVGLLIVEATPPSPPPQK